MIIVNNIIQEAAISSILVTTRTAKVCTASSYLSYCPNIVQYFSAYGQVVCAAVSCSILNSNSDQYVNKSVTKERISWYRYLLTPIKVRETLVRQ